VGTTVLYFHDSHLQQNDTNPKNMSLPQKSYVIS